MCHRHLRFIEAQAEHLPRAGAPGPNAFAVRAPHPSSDDNVHVHRSPPRVGNDAYALCAEAGCTRSARFLIFGTRNFDPLDPASPIELSRFVKFIFARTRFGTFFKPGERRAPAQITQIDLPVGQINWRPLSVPALTPFRSQRTNWDRKNRRRSNPNVWFPCRSANRQAELMSRTRRRMK